MAHQTTITSTVRSYPNLPYEAIKRDILGANYDLSLTFVGATRAKAFNQQYRQKDYIPNVLSFPLDDTHGEIIICPAVSAKQAPRYEMTAKGYIGFLFIHGCLHLKGHDHGATMEEAEARYKKKYHLA